VFNEEIQHQWATASTHKATTKKSLHRSPRKRCNRRRFTDERRLFVSTTHRSHPFSLGNDFSRLSAT